MSGIEFPSNDTACSAPVFQLQIAKQSQLAIVDDENAVSPAISRSSYLLALSQRLSLLQRSSFGLVANASRIV